MQKARPVRAAHRGRAAVSQGFAVMTFDLDDLGAHVGEIAAEAGRPELRDFEHADAFEEVVAGHQRAPSRRSEEHTSELQSLMRISYAVFCLKKKNMIESTEITKYHVNTEI